MQNECVSCRWPGFKRNAIALLALITAKNKECVKWTKLEAQRIFLENINQSNLSINCLVYSLFTFLSSMSSIQTLMSYFLTFLTTHFKMTLNAQMVYERKSLFPECPSSKHARSQVTLTSLIKRHSFRSTLPSTGPPHWTEVETALRLGLPSIGVWERGMKGDGWR